MPEHRRPSTSEPGGHAPFQQLLAQHGDRLLRSAYLLCGDEIEAQDLVQETFFQALKSAPQFRGDSTLYTWLHGILRHLCCRHLRKQKRLVLDEDPSSAETIPAATPSGSDAEFCTAQVTLALQKLSPEHREVVVLRYYENMKIAEIARHTGVSAGTVKSRLHYATRSLEELLPGELNLFVSEGTHSQAMQ